MQALHIGSNSCNFLVSHIPGNILHHFARIVTAIRATECFELLDCVVRILATQHRKPCGRITRPGRPVTRHTGSNACDLVAATIDALPRFKVNLVRRANRRLLGGKKRLPDLPCPVRTGSRPGRPSGDPCAACWT